MSTSLLSRDQLVKHARFSREDLAEITRRRRNNNRLGFAYQLAFVRLAHRFPTEEPFEIIAEQLNFVSVQLNIAVDEIEVYRERRQTIAEHRTAITIFLGLNRFGDVPTEPLEDYLFQEACRLEQTGHLLMQAKRFLRKANILFPADDTLRRLIITQWQAARAHIYKRISNGIPPDLKQRRKIRSALASFHLLGRLLLDDEIDDGQLRDTVFGEIDRNTLANQVESVEIWLTGKYSHVFNLVVQHFSYLRQFAPSLINGLDFRPEISADSSLISA